MSHPDPTREYDIEIEPAGLSKDCMFDDCGGCISETCNCACHKLTKANE